MVEAPSSPIKQLMFAKETTWGTAVTTDKDIGLIIVDATPSWTKEVMESLGMGQIETQKITTGIFEPKMTINGEFQHGRILEYVFGTVAHATTGSDEKHTFTIADSAPSATIGSAFNMTADIDVTSSGMLIETCEIATETNGKLMLNTAWTGQTILTDTTAPSFTQSTLPVFPHALVVCSIGGSPATITQSASITIEKTIEKAGGLGSNIYQQAAATECKFKFAATLGFTDATYHALFLGGTSPSLTSDPAATTFGLVADNGTALGSGQRNLTISLANCQMDGLTEPTAVGGLVFVEVTGAGTLNECFSVDNIASGSW
jgi:hypothetical protein